MSFKYGYASALYDTEVLAQSAVPAMKNRLDNHPTDWVEVKEITGSEDAGWLVLPTLLTDTEILNSDSSKNYMCYCPWDGSNTMPLTSTELTEKVNDLRRLYAGIRKVNTIDKLDVNDFSNSVTLAPSIDMSGYL